MVSLLITPTLHGVALRRDVRRRCGMRERPVLQLDSRAPLTLEDVRFVYMHVPWAAKSSEPNAALKSSFRSKGAKAAAPLPPSTQPAGAFTPPNVLYTLEFLDLPSSNAHAHRHLFCRDAYEVCSLIPEPGERGQCYSVFGLDSSRMASYYETVLDLEDRLAAGDGQHQHRSCDGASTSSPASSLALAAPGQQDHAAADTSATSVAAAASEARSRQHASSAAVPYPHLTLPTNRQVTSSVFGESYKTKYDT